MDIDMDMDMDTGVCSYAYTVVRVYLVRVYGCKVGALLRHAFVRVGVGLELRHHVVQLTDEHGDLLRLRGGGGG